MTRDPVCLMALEPQQAHTMEEYQGRSYYFCSKGCQSHFLKEPRKYSQEQPGMQMTIGVMGSASNDQSTSNLVLANSLGEAIAERNFILITGACPGLPYECALGARKRNGLSVGISPALSLDEHIHQYQSPTDAFDLIIYTGSGLMGREVTNIRSSDIVVIIGGSSGTLGEFSIAYDEGKLIGVMKGSGGITDLLPDLEKSLAKDTGSVIIYHSDPKVLINKLIMKYKESHYRKPSCFCTEHND